MNNTNEQIQELISAALAKALEAGDLPAAKDLPEIAVEEPKADAHGDFATNFALVSARVFKMAPKKIAEALIHHLPEKEGLVADIRVEGPGFINFFLSPKAWHPVLEQVLEKGPDFGRVNRGKGQKIQVEFVSANPTGPLHVGHGRGAAVGDVAARILEWAGYEVQREYYINDAGRQIRTLGLSVFLRYKALAGHEIDYPEDAYQGAYIADLAAELLAEKKTALLDMDEEEAIGFCARRAAKVILEEIRRDLEAFGVVYDRWYSEQSLYDRDLVLETIENFRQKGVVYEKEGALWFKTTRWGDEKDRVVVRANGQTTYFASDITYHREKFERGFDKVIDVWGADHHGYIPRVSAAIQACGLKAEQFQVILVYLVNLLRAGNPVAMSTRAGKFVTLKDVVDEVGTDAARFIFLTRSFESPLDFDLELAKQKTNDNPVYYVQYVHARICSIVQKAMEAGVEDLAGKPEDTGLLTEPEEINLLKCLSRFPQQIALAAQGTQPHRICFFLMELASAFHAYYNRHKVLTQDAPLTSARLRLVSGVRRVIQNGLTILGVSAPERM